MSETLKTLAAVVTLPVVCSWRLARSTFDNAEKEKPWRRVVFDSIFRWAIYTQSIDQLAYLFPGTEETYTAWVKKKGLPETIDSLEEDTKVMWIGPKASSKFILYLHGGGFSLPMTEDVCNFWLYAQKQLAETESVDFSIAIVKYTLVPHAHFPTPLHQTVAALNHLLSAGIEPSNIIVAGDSAGGNLTLQLLLHMIHPISGIPQVPAGTKLGGAYLMSPWLDILARNPVPSYNENRPWDITLQENLKEFGDRAKAGITDDKLLPYIDRYVAPEGWYNGLDSTVESVLITSGGKESLRDDIVQFSEIFSKSHPKTKLYVDKIGLHVDPYLDFFAGEKKLCETTPIIISWVRDIFKK